MNTNNIITVDLFNKLTGQETLHPLVGLVNLLGGSLREDLRMPCDFYALICRLDGIGAQTSLQLVNPGEVFELPATFHRKTKGYTGVIFHPDLLCDTPLEGHMADYPARCSCHRTLTEREQQTIVDCISKIDSELHHAIDRHSSTIIVSHIELLLNYCMRFCSRYC